MYSVILTLSALHILVIGAQAAPKILICSDSTTAEYNSSSPLQGWGHFLGEYVSIPVVNKAKNGRSTRSFIREGLWSQLLAMSSPGDFVVIEMGHNDVSF
jgi:rhamnogalacturonan acetylesterase